MRTGNKFLFHDEKSEKIEVEKEEEMEVVQLVVPKDNEVEEKN